MKSIKKYLEISKRSRVKIGDLNLQTEAVLHTVVVYYLIRMII